MQFRLGDEAATAALGAALSAVLSAREPGAAAVLIALSGDLGAGKTTLARGFLRALGVTGPVRSPTYTLVEPYSTAALQVFHLDLYRIVDPDELEQLGLRELTDPDTVLLVEWSERGRGNLPAPTLTLHLAIDGDGRRVSVESHNATGAGIARQLDAELRRATMP